jgi:monoamine oxidase
MLEFKEAVSGKRRKKVLAFLFTNEIIPTWWTQSPSSYPLLTGWAGGRKRGHWKAKTIRRSWSWRFDH